MSHDWGLFVWKIWVLESPPPQKTTTENLTASNIILTTAYIKLQS